MIRGIAILFQQVCCDGLPNFPLYTGFYFLLSLSSYLFSSCSSSEYTSECAWLSVYGEKQTVVVYMLDMTLPSTRTAMVSF